MIYRLLCVGFSCKTYATFVKSDLVSAYLCTIMMTDTCFSMYFDLKNSILMLFEHPEVRLTPWDTTKLLPLLKKHVFHHISAYIHCIIICDTCIFMYFDLKNTIMKLFLCPDVYLTLWGTWNIYVLSKNHIFDHISTYTYVKMICDTLVIMYICPLNSFQVLF